MTNHLEFYRCEICGNIVQVIHSGNGELVCCGKPMQLLSAKSKSEEKQEKHVPVFISDNEIQIGSEPHPMSKEHHISFIETVSEDQKSVQIKFLDINEFPKMITNNTAYNTAYEYCNIHGLWQGER